MANSPYYDFQGKKILYAILNWGLGHASRSIPIIQSLRNNNEVHLASDGIAARLLEEEFPKLTIHKLPSYNIKYKGGNLITEMIFQLPKIMAVYHKEKQAVRELDQGHSYDVIISDHRYGCYVKGKKNIFLAHQINILSNVNFLSVAGTKVNRRLISAYSECWIPDDSNARLSGKLSTPNHLSIPTKYIGPLSRMVKSSSSFFYDIVIILSGPEPARSKLEKKLLDVIIDTTYKIAIVRGSDSQHSIQIHPNVTVFNLLPYKQLNEILNKSAIVICRSGYSSIMDLEKLGKKAILIPTPGQTEQEYLSHHLSLNSNYVTITELNLPKELMDTMRKMLNF